VRARKSRAQNRSVLSIHEDWTKTILGFCSSSSKAAQKRSRRFCEHGAFVQDVQYADFAGAKIGDAAIAEKGN